MKQPTTKEMDRWTANRQLRIAMRHFCAQVLYNNDATDAWDAVERAAFAYSDVVGEDRPKGWKKIYHKEAGL